MQHEDCSFSKGSTEREVVRARFPNKKCILFLTAIVTSGSCRDRMGEKFCAVWKSFCKNIENFRRKCAKTCGKCNGRVTFLFFLGFRRLNTYSTVGKTCIPCFNGAQ